jgi:hypothetical protein
LQPPSVERGFEVMTRSHRRLYWSVAPADLHPAVLEHARLGCALLPAVADPARRTLAAALAESYLLAGRIEFFDMRQPDRAGETLLRALQAAGEADDPLLGAAVLAHTAFIPGWSGDRDSATEHMVAARTYVRRAPASAEFLAWLDAVEPSARPDAVTPATPSTSSRTTTRFSRPDPSTPPLPGWTGSVPRASPLSKATCSSPQATSPRPARRSGPPWTICCPKQKR